MTLMTTNIDNVRTTLGRPDSRDSAEQLHDMVSQTLSIANAVASPPPMHNAATPRVPPVAASA